MQIVWLEQPMFCCCYYEATATVITVLCSYYFLRRKVMFAAWRERRLWPPTSGKCLSGGLQILQCCCCWTIGKWHQDGLPWHRLTASVIPQMPHGSYHDGEELGTESEVRLGSAFTCTQQRAGLFHSEPASQISLKPSQGERWLDST